MKVLKTVLLCLCQVGGLLKLESLSDSTSAALVVAAVTEELSHVRSLYLLHTLVLERARALTEVASRELVSSLAAAATHQVCASFQV